MVAVHEGELTRAIDAIESRFYLGGVAKRGIKLTVGNAECKFPMNKADAAAKLPGVFTAARQSAFGHGSETVLDPSVRVAKELTASEFQVNFDPQTEGILENVRQQQQSEQQQLVGKRQHCAPLANSAVKTYEAVITPPVSKYQPVLATMAYLPILAECAAGDITILPH